MDFWASLEHQLRYKRDNEFTEEMGQELFECAQLSAMLDTKMDNLRRDIHQQNKLKIISEPDDYEV